MLEFLLIFFTIFLSYTFGYFNFLIENKNKDNCDFFTFVFGTLNGLLFVGAFTTLVILVIPFPFSLFVVILLLVANIKLCVDYFN
jgi:hypothetical protein